MSYQCNPNFTSVCVGMFLRASLFMHVLRGKAVVKIAAFSSFSTAEGCCRGDKGKSERRSRRHLSYLEGPSLIQPDTLERGAPVATETL
ncbi:hypothetical protein GOODEAATRI_025218, partial [Goodea atripinnis]